ncbi:MAG TPA: isocitrate/isopropylmalate family dehydrogenase [Pseudomonadales bacterium]|nr:isocitrate/isopropylmalate family dehydrogenase [Pseudomonadales bacterium]
MTDASVVEITELCGDGIGPELEASIATVADALPLNFKFRKIDWSLANREVKGLESIDEAEAAMRATGIGLKYPTVTGTRSPNALLRRRLDFSVIYRPAISIPGISSNFKENVNCHIVRVATGGTYDDPGQLIGKHAAVSLRMVEREPCMHAAHFAFRLARDKKMTMTSSSKHTIQRVTDGLFEAVVDEIHDIYDKDVEHHKELFDALLAKLIMRPDDYQVVLVLNEYGDFLSDMASGLVGSLGTGASGNYSFDENHDVALAMFDPAGGTAPDIAGQNKANPAAIMLAFGMLLDHIGRYDVGHALRLSLLGAIADGQCTRDLRGKLSTTEFTAEVVRRLPEHLPS